MTTPLKIGISACLLGQNVRWNGGHALNRFVAHTLGHFVSFVPVCPEMECGLGTPRETLRLVGSVEAPRLVTTKTGIDHTERMQTWAKKRLDQLAEEDLCGFIFKKDSPSSGLLRVKVYNEKGQPVKKGVGMFARAFTERFPRIPVEEEGRLNDPKLRENFIEQIFTLRDWRNTLSERKAMGRLVAFHTRQKMLILSHSQKHYREMGKLVAAGKEMGMKALHDRYEALLMEALSLKTTIKKNTNVLLHILGHFKKQLSADEKQEMLELIDNYRAEQIPLIVPVTLVNHYVRKYDKPYLAQQTYLNPHPLELKLRNHA
ncbi:MAG: DUF523 and DUF1722 domain-containing protein [Desulfosarcinaceae bacterium]|nr:DUF523 and DUF1722 domain-containing protein [Desulfosarcinaceae bacterium]